MATTTSTAGLTSRTSVGAEPACMLRRTGFTNAPIAVGADMPTRQDLPAVAVRTEALAGFPEGRAGIV